MSELRPEQILPPRAGRPVRRIIDVRAPAEVAKGALPGALCLPILNDAERKAVGLRYAQAGPGAAIEEGRIQTQADMPERERAWRKAAEDEPSAFMCWRGGMRSELAQRLTTPPFVPRVAGGYKAMRSYLMASLPPSLGQRTTWVVTGPTGSGKTELLHEANSLPSLLALDLEGAAEHRGSAFGAIGPQPAQATFEHRLALPLLLGREAVVLLEDESQNVGRLHLPDAIYAELRRAPLLVVEDDLDARVRRIHRDYALAPARRDGEAAALAALVAAVRRLRQRLGAKPTERMVASLKDAHTQGAWNDPEAFRGVIETLLRDYYDPLYRKATPTDRRALLAKGTQEELLMWLKERTQRSHA
ncbi:MAG: tRNA 2-selenouridine(34) synthase MnmH [Xanthomonadales bacterium]|nr:tRNA 2-selenouridine(34) synthase MnmH [Xanthomonadales bacterium]